MARFGVPMCSRPSHSTYRMVVTVEWPDGRVEFKRWRGGSVKGIKRAAREAYQGAHLQFGTALRQDFWGAH